MHAYVDTHRHTQCATHACAQVLNTRPPHVQRAAVDFINFLYTPPAQREFGRLGFRINPKLAKQAAQEQVRAMVVMIYPRAGAGGHVRGAVPWRPPARCTRLARKAAACAGRVCRGAWARAPCALHAPCHSPWCSPVSLGSFYGPLS